MLKAYAAVTMTVCLGGALIGVLAALKGLVVLCCVGVLLTVPALVGE